MKLLLALLALCIAQPVFAQSRSVQIEYSPYRVYAVTGKTSITTMIQFGDDETIENIALGDAAAWQVTPNKRANMLFIKPLFARGKTNMTVITNRRRYMFDLVVGGARSHALYAIQFAYPEDRALAALLAQKVDAAMDAKAAPPPAPPKLNSQWKISGDKKITPARIYDDGESTYIAWSQNTEIPGIFVLGGDRTEGPVNFSVRGDYLVIDGVASEYILRMGKARATLTNLAPPPPKPVTTQPEVNPKPSGAMP